MDYEKAYKEALKRAKILYNDKNEIGYANAESVLEEVFPLLKEPEDEKIRKALIEMVHDTTGDSLWVDYNVHKEDAIAWLEKQGEQEVNEPDWCHHKVDLSDCSEEYRKAYYDGWNNCNQQHSQCNAEQKPAYSEEDEHRVKDTIYFLDTAKKHYASTVELDTCIDWLKSLRGRYTWKPSDEQMEALFVLLPTVSYGRNPAFSLYNDLKKLRGE